jgi:hypothetical protein
LPAARVRTLLEKYDVERTFERELRSVLALQRSWLTRDRVGLAVLLRIVRASRRISLSVGEGWDEQVEGEFLHVDAGELTNVLGESAGTGDWLGVFPGKTVPKRPQRWTASVAVDGLVVARSALLDVPVVCLRLLEHANRMAREGGVGDA